MTFVRALWNGLNRLIAAIALILLSPVILGVALWIRLADGPGVLFKQARAGRGGKPFTMVKFRSMVHNSVAMTASMGIADPFGLVEDDPRITPCGKFLRRTSLDELPQLWNIFRGDMTLVGPRPERPHFVDQFSAEYDRYSYRHRVQAGLTGLAQVSGLRGNTSIADRARFDNYYIEHWSLWLDIKIIIRTFSEVLFARGR
jgi:lipopolysaccharide/colanic/teichoic acid biosynthesis glycosyltransferase